MPGEPLKPGAIYNSNRFTLRGLLQAAGCEVADLGIVPDRLDATRDALRRAAADNHLIITSGGVSVGEEDHLRPAVAAEGTIENWQIAMKPGKPLALGRVRRANGTAALFIGLPGNPVSSFVTFLLAVSPVLRVMQGLPASGAAPLPLRAAFAWPKPDRRREFPARAAERRRRARTVREPELGRADLGGVGRWPARQPAGAGHRAGRCRSLPADVGVAGGLMKVSVRYFASLREALGPGETAELPEGSTVARLREQLAAQGGRHAEVLAEERLVRSALAQRMCSDDAVIGEGDEVAFFPPVTGG